MNYNEPTSISFDFILHTLFSELTPTILIEVPIDAGKM